MSRGLFVIGTDTGVGKTTVSVGLVKALSRDRVVSVMKPFETGGGDDARRLIHASGRALDPSLVNPCRFDLPAAPEVAASREGKQVDLSILVQAYAALSAAADLTVVEGAGGLLVPLGQGTMLCDLIAQLEIPVLIVARTSLGTINHSLLTAEVARARGLRVLGIVFSRSNPIIGPEEEDSLASLLRHGQLDSFGILPHQESAVLSDEERLAEEVRTHLNVDRLIDTIYKS